MTRVVVMPAHLDSVIILDSSSYVVYAHLFQRQDLQQFCCSCPIIT